MNYQEVEVLLIEDNPYEAQLTIRCLKQFNLNNSLLHIEDAVNALDFIFQRGEYAGSSTTQNLKVIFLDLKLPKVDGLEILRQIKSNEMTKVIPVVVLTSSKEESDVERAYQTGANSFMVKPVDFETFNQVISGIARYWILSNEPPSMAKKADNR